MPAPDRITVLMVNAPVESWNGIERFTALTALELFARRVPGNDLSGLAPLRTLRRLHVHLPPGVSNVDTIGSLPLESLDLWVRGPVGSPDAWTWLSALTGLKQLTLIHQDPGDWFIELDFLRAMTSLREVAINGFYPVDPAPYRELPRSLQRLMFSGRTRDEIQQVRDALPWALVESGGRTADEPLPAPGDCGMLTAEGNQAVSRLVGEIIDGLSNGDLVGSAAVRRRLTVGHDAIVEAGHAEIGDTEVRQYVAEILEPHLADAGIEIDRVLDW